MSGTVTIVAPAASDGRGGTAILNAAGASDFVGYLFDTSGFDGPAVRTSQDNVVEGQGAVFGSFYHGPRSFTMEVLLARGSTPANSFANRDKLYRATNAMAGNGTITWTETGGSARMIAFRREQPPRGPDKDGHVLLSGIAADPRIYSSGLNTSATSTSLTLTNAGNMSTPPTFTVASPSATITFTNTTTGQSLSFVGLDGSGTLTIDFGAKTVDRGGTNKYSKVAFPSSVWWELVPGSNSITITNSATATWRDAWL